MILLASGSSSRGTREEILQEVKMAASSQSRERDRSPKSQTEADTAGTKLQITTTNHSAAADGRQSDRGEDSSVGSTQTRSQSQNSSELLASRIDIRLLVRRREAGALIGKQGANIKRMRDQYKSSTFNIPDTGNGPERIVCITSESWSSLDSILLEISQLFLDKNCALNSTCEDQVELKQLINSAYAGLLIGMGGQSIRKLRNDSKAAIKIYEMCCPSSEERVCAIKARPPVVVATIRMIHDLMLASQASIRAPLLAQKPYDALNFDSNQVDKYGGHLNDDCGPTASPAARASSLNSFNQQCHNQQHYFQHSNNAQHLFHFDPLSQAEVPLVVSSPVMFRPGTILSPVHTFDFAPLHPLANGRQFMSFPVNKSWSRIGRLPPPPLSTPGQANIVHDHFNRQQVFRGTPSAMHPPRSQRFHPYESRTLVRPAERATATRHRNFQNQADADRPNQQQVTGRQILDEVETHSQLAARDVRPAEQAKEPRHDNGQ